MNFIHLYDKHIAEFITFPKSEEEIELGGKKYYKNKELNEKLKKVVEKHAPSNVAKVLISAIDKEIITPVYIDKNIPQYIINFVSSKHRYHSKGRTYHLTSKGYIFINPKLFFVNSLDVFETLIHELMHVISLRHQKAFYRINFPVIITFYRTFFSEYFSLAKSSCVKDDMIISLVNSIKKSEKANVINFYKLYYSLIKLIAENCTINKSVKEFETLADDFVSYLDERYEKFSETVPSNIWRAGLKAYSVISGGKGKMKTIGQEFWNPEEIIASISELDSSHKNVVATLMLLR
jgi:hypothetical protein